MEINCTPSTITATPVYNFFTMKTSLTQWMCRLTAGALFILCSLPTFAYGETHAFAYTGSQTMSDLDLVLATANDQVPVVQQLEEQMEVASKAVSFAPETADLAPAMAVIPQTTLFTTPGNYTFVVPAGVTSIDVEAWGGGGGGGGEDGNDGGGGGGGGGFAGGTLNVSPGDNIVIVVGAGGAGALSEDTNGSAGTASTVTGPDAGETFVAGGGGPGLFTPNGGGDGGSGGTGSTGGAVVGGTTYSGGDGGDGDNNEGGGGGGGAGSAGNGGNGDNGSQGSHDGGAGGTGNPDGEGGSGGNDGTGGNGSAYGGGGGG